MTKMTRFFWSAPGIALYLYTITILVQNGYNDYFNIPKTFIESSLVANITFFWKIVPGLISLFTEHWFIILLVIIVMSVMFFSSGRYIQATFILFITLIMLWLAYGSYSFGIQLAKLTSSFYSFKKECSPVRAEENIRYVGPTVYEDKVILVPINASNTLQNGIRVIGLTNTDCDLEINDIGIIKH